MRRKCGVSCGPDPAPIGAEAEGEPTFLDPVTYDECEWADTDAPACGHRASKATWTGLIASALTDPNAALLTRCVRSGGDGGCSELLRARMFAAYAGEAGYAKYREALVRAFASTNPYIAFCTAPGCNQVRGRVGGYGRVRAGGAGYALDDKFGRASGVA